MFFYESDAGDLRRSCRLRPDRIYTLTFYYLNPYDDADSRASFEAMQYFSPASPFQTSAPLAYGTRTR